MHDVVRKPQPKSVKLLWLCATASVVFLFADFPMSTVIAVVLAIAPLLHLMSLMQYANEEVSLKLALDGIDVIRDGARLVGTEAIVVTKARLGYSHGIRTYRALLRTKTRDWFVVDLCRTEPHGRAAVTSISIISQNEALETLEDDPERYIFWSAQIDSESRADVGSTSIASTPFTLVTIQAQGAEHTEPESLIRSLESALARLRAGEIEGEESDDDFGYRFQVSTNQAGTIFPAPASMIRPTFTHGEQMDARGNVATTHRLEQNAWSDELQCFWRAWRVVSNGTLALELAEGDCCDMNAAIRIATQLMPCVSRISTYSGDVIDTEYRKSNGQWEVAAPPVG